MPTWSSDTDWNNGQSETGVHHEQPANTDWAAADVLEKGYPTSDEGGSSLELYWPLDEDSAPINDVGPNGNDGSVTVADNANGSIDHTAAGILGTGGVDITPEGYVIESGSSIPAISKGSTGFTVSLWVKPQTIGSGRSVSKSIWESCPGGSDRVGLSMFSGQVIAGIYDGNSYFTTAAADVTTGTWYLVVVTYDGTSISIYLDGSEATATPADDPNIDDFSPFQLGGRAYEPSDNEVEFKTADAAYSDVRVYSRTLTAAQITGLYNAVI